MIDQTNFRQATAPNLMRYRVGGATQCVIPEGMGMTVAPGFQVAGLIVVRGLLIVKKGA